jgi:hypothetical protein
MKCAAPLDWDSLLAYWLGELDTDSAENIEEHYLGCAVCSRRLEQLAILARGVRTVARSSGVNMVVTEPFVRRLAEHGLHVREYRVPRNSAVNCTVTADDDIVVARLEAPLDSVARLDLVTLGSDGEAMLRQEDIPFTAASGGVVVSTRIDVLRALPAMTLRMRLLAVDANGERALGEYTFNHVPERAAQENTD